MTYDSVLVWFRNDLRLHDHEALHKASQQAANVVPVFVFDPRWFIELDLGFRKTDALRTQFLIESVLNLRQNLQKIGSDLIVRVGKPEEIIPQITQEVGAKAVFTSEEITQEEIDVDSQVEQRLEAIGVEMKFFWMSTLFHHDDIPFDIDQLPDIFTEYRKQTERVAKIRPTFPIPNNLLLHTSIDSGNIPTLIDLGFDSQPTQPPYKGGETEALNRLDAYFWQQDRLRIYKETRNEMLGLDYSSKFSVWLANGCISPRHIYEEVKRYEYERTANDSTYWLIFELIWRDYFRFVALKYGNRIFMREGIKKDKKTNWLQHQPVFDVWRRGQTGVPLIDACMRELQQTGFMSNRGRQNVASFLTKDLHIDWTWGAAWFESQLLDYDVCSNWGNWNYVAGVGNDPRENRYFNIYKQATRYDAEGLFVKHWLPELFNVPTSKIHLVSMLTTEEQKRFNVQIGIHYPKSLVNVAKWLQS